MGYGSGVTAYSPRILAWLRALVARVRSCPGR
jgi:hypothetical protein